MQLKKDPAGNARWNKIEEGTTESTGWLSSPGNRTTKINQSHRAARKFVRTLGLNSRLKWKVYCRTRRTSMSELKKFIDER